MYVSVAPRFWESLQVAFNKTVTASFTPRERIKIVFTLDDNKKNYGYGCARNIKFGCESGLKRVRHIKNNKTGHNNHTMCYAVSAIPLVPIFAHENHVNEYEVFGEVMQVFFDLKGSAKLNLSGRATLSVG